nr:hypothetical protein [Conexibacter sp. SYSU D00693]
MTQFAFDALQEALRLARDVPPRDAQDAPAGVLQERVPSGVLELCDDALVVRAAVRLDGEPLLAEDDVDLEELACRDLHELVEPR